MGFDRERPRGAGTRTDANQAHAGVPGKRTLTEALPVNAGKTVKECYMEQYKQISGGK